MDSSGTHAKRTGVDGFPQSSTGADAPYHCAGYNYLRVQKLHDWSVRCLRLSSPSKIAYLRFKKGIYGEPCEAV